MTIVSSVSIQRKVCLCERERERERGNVVYLCNAHLIILVTSIHPSIICPFYPLRVALGLEPIQGDIGRDTPWTSHQCVTG